jgi:hypothetical protein
MTLNVDQIKFYPNPPLAEAGNKSTSAVAIPIAIGNGGQSK